MKPTLLFSALLTLQVLFTLSLPAATPDGWTDDFAAAQEQAREEGKYLLVDFTGSDWCGWCIKLSREVFETPLFQSEAPKKFVLVYIDYPRDTSQLRPEVQAQNDRLKTQYQIRGYPTVLIMDPEGNVLAQTGYQPGGPAAYLEHLDEWIVSTRAFAEARKAAEPLEGLDRARQLDRALQQVPEDQRAGYSDLINEICTLDHENEAGLYAKYLMDGVVFPMFIAFMETHRSDNAERFAEMQALQADPAQAEAFEALEAEFRKDLREKMEILRAQLLDARGDYPLTGEQDQRFFAMLAQTQSMSRNKPEVIRMLTQAIEAAPNTPMAESLRGHLQNVQRALGP